jgi:hypothetical protein
MAVPDYQAPEADEREFAAPTLPPPLPREHLEPAQHRRSRLMLVIAVSLVLVEAAWVVALSVFTYWAVT